MKGSISIKWLRNPNLAYHIFFSLVLYYSVCDYLPLKVVIRRVSYHPWGVVCFTISNLLYVYLCIVDQLTCHIVDVALYNGDYLIDNRNGL